MIRLPDFNDKEVEALKALAHAAVKLDGLVLVPAANMLLMKILGAEKIEPSDAVEIPASKPAKSEAE